MKKLSLCQKIDLAILGIYFLVITPWALDTGCEMIFHEYLFTQSFRNSSGFLKYKHICNIVTIFAVVYAIMRLIYDKIKKIKSRTET